MEENQRMVELGKQAAKESNLVVLVPKQIMEDWEKELREKLNKELEDDILYEIRDTSGFFYLATGKQGMIQWEVELMRHIKKLVKDN